MYVTNETNEIKTKHRNKQYIKSKNKNKSKSDIRLNVMHRVVMDDKNLKFLTYAFLYMRFRRKRPLMDSSLHILTYTYVHTLTVTHHRYIAVCGVHIQTNLIDKSIIPLNKILRGTNRVT